MSAGYLVNNTRNRGNPSAQLGLPLCQGNPTCLVNTSMKIRRNQWEC